MKEIMFPLFASSPWVLLNVLCFVLSVFCGYLITRHYDHIKEHTDESGLFNSVVVGIGIGFLLIFDGFRQYDLPQFGRILIGLVGGILGHYLFQVSQIKKW
jgi:uncharacterized membrane protein YeaQ/YmgE (transglycosylase-associated protein family)